MFARRLLRDGSRLQNLLTFSEQFENAVWLPAGITTTSNSAVAPNGAVTADTITENAVVTTPHRFQRIDVTLTAGVTYTLSVYVKRGVGARQFQLGITGIGWLAKAYFDLSNGAIGYTQECTASVTAVANDFYRVSMVVNATTSGVLGTFLAMTSSLLNSSETYSGDGTSSIILWGAQLNEGETASDYVQTEATAIL
jgi:hypothetical protein